MPISRRPVFALLLLAGLLGPQRVQAEDADEDVRQLSPIVMSIEGGRLDAARRPLQKVCGIRVSRRCQYVWARYYELQGEYFAALSSYDQFIRLAKTEPNPDEKLRRQIDDAHNRRIELSQRLQPVAAPDSVEGMIDSLLPPAPHSGREPPSGPGTPPASVPPPPMAATTTHEAPPSLPLGPASLQIDTDLSGVVAQGLDGYPDGITLDRGATVLKQPEGTRYVSFHLPGGYQVMYRDLKLRAGEKYPLEVLWRPQLQAEFPNLQRESDWRAFVDQRVSPARYGHKVDRGDWIALGISAAMLISSAIVTGAIFRTSVIDQDTGLRGTFLGAIPLFAGVIGTGVTLYSILSAIPKQTMPLPGRDLFGRPLPVSREVNQPNLLP